MISVALTAGAQQLGTDTALPEDQFSVQRFDSPPGPRNFITTRGLRMDGEWSFSGGLLANYAKEPFVVSSCPPANEPGPCEDLPVVDNLIAGDLLASVTPIPLLQIGLKFPLVFVDGDGLANGRADALGGGIEAFGMGDLMLEAKLRAVGAADSSWTVGGAAFGTLPTGQATADDSYLGDEAPSGGAKAIIDGRIEPISIGVNVGYAFRQSATVGVTEVGSELRYGVAAGVTVSPMLSIIADLFGSSQLGSETGANAMELNAGLSLRPPNSPVSLTAGGGVGLQKAVGVPVARGFFGLLYIAELRDKDQDGVADNRDNCPTVAEDIDGFQDDDGCPDDDNDNDAIVDDMDKCPDQAEDIDGYQDNDGCPEPDNDGDGLNDVADRCPMEPETKNGWEDDDGCPDVPDRDEDGIEDDKDQCPDQAEDTDGFEDLDGCPEEDNDQDGIPDTSDECIDEAEDFDDDEDEDGCPEGEEEEKTTKPN